MMRNTTNTTNATIRKDPAGKEREGTAWRGATAAAAALCLLGLAAASLTAPTARAAAPPPVPVTVDVARPAPERPAPRAGVAAPPHLFKRAAPITQVTTGAAVPVPVRSGPAREGAREGTHIVRAGETLWAVAAAYARSEDPRAVRETFDALLRANRHRFRTGRPDLIFPGERLLVPSRYGPSPHG